MAQHPLPPDPTLRLAADWITICQSEASALSTDREMQEALQRFSALWAQQASAWLQAVGCDPSGRAGPASSPGTAPAAAAPDAVDARNAASSAPASAVDPRDAVITALLDRVAALERQRA